MLPVEGASCGGTFFGEAAVEGVVAVFVGVVIGAYFDEAVEGVVGVVDVVAGILQACAVAAFVVGEGAVTV